MKTLIINKSIHHGNTERIAQRMAEILDADLMEPRELGDIREYDLIGFGSGIYDAKHHRALLELADKLPKATNRKAFIFSTSGVRVDSRLFRNAREFHTPLRERLQSRGYRIVGEFNCKGFDTNSFLKYIGGINKGRPNAEDLRDAEEFAKKMKEEGRKKYVPLREYGKKKGLE